MSTASATYWCGESVGCGTTTDESDEEVPVAKKPKVDVKSRRRSKRLKSVSQRQTKDTEDGSGSHCSQETVRQKKQKDSVRRGGRQQGKTSQAKASGIKGRQQKDSETGY